MQSYDTRYCGIMTAILGRIAEGGNAESGPHVLHISRLTALLLRKLIGEERALISEGYIALIASAAALHDIGKVDVPSEILNKPGSLDEEERKIMQTHTSSGAAILDGLPGCGSEPFVRCARDICLWHHERWDGGGYPHGLRGDDIPLSAQIVSVVDVYDALTSQRCYKAAIPHGQAMDMLLSGECGAFNPFLLESFAALDGELRTALEEADAGSGGE